MTDKPKVKTEKEKQAEKEALLRATSMPELERKIAAEAEAMNAHNEAASKHRAEWEVLNAEKQRRLIKPPGGAQ